MTILIFFILLAILILSHELGHFLAARFFKIRVEEFGFGFPPRLMGLRRRGTIYSVNLIPFGGFVKIFGEDGGDPTDPENFASRSVRQRFLVVVAGVIMNVLLATFLFAAAHALGLPAPVPEGSLGAQVVIIGVSPFSPAEKAKVLIGDIVRKVKAEDEEINVGTTHDLQAFVERHHGSEIILEVERGGESLPFLITPRDQVPQGEGPLGVALMNAGIQSYPWHKALWQGFRSTLVSLVLTFQVIVGLVRDLFVGELTIARSVSGPVGIYFLVGGSIKAGLGFLMYIAGLISINLAAFNILPIPALDGGRIAFLFVEKFRGAPINPRLERLVHTVGFVVLLALVILVTYRDIIRFF